jgi:hypothetical protein
MRHRTAATLAALPLVLAGCGTSSGSSGSDAGATHVMPDGSTMSGSSMGASDGSSMSADEASEKEPSETASMICSDEIREAVAHTLLLEEAPEGLHSFSDQLFRCSYLLDAGELRLSVKDLDTAGPGEAYFESLRRQLPGPTTIKGLANFGFPAFETRHGDVVFIKDHKTLWVDASRLQTKRLPAGMTRQDVAYGVAAAVIGCWTE